MDASNKYRVNNVEQTALQINQDQCRAANQAEHIPTNTPKKKLSFGVLSNRLTSKSFPVGMVGSDRENSL